MIFLIILIPVIGAILAWRLYEHDEIKIKVVTCTLWIPSVLFVIVYLCMYQSVGSSTEYLGGYVEKTTYYEPWNERVRHTHTRTVKVGNTTTTQTYYTYTIDWHPEKYSYNSSIDRNEHYIDKEMFDKINAVMGHPDKVFKDMHRDYHTVDGDAYEYNFNEADSLMFPVTKKSSYWNPIKANPYTIMGEEKIEKEEAEELKLFEYPKIKDDDQCPVLSDLGEVPDSQSIPIRRLNGKYGKSHEFRMYLLLFHDKGPEYADFQKRYWCNGNKNELVICLGIAKDSVQWCRGFSWSDKPVLELKSRQYFQSNKKLDIAKYAKFIQQNINSWERKEFKDFDYISVELSGGQIAALIILTFVSTVILLVSPMLYIVNKYG